MQLKCLRRRMYLCFFSRLHSSYLEVSALEHMCGRAAERRRDCVNLKCFGVNNTTSSTTLPSVY